MSFKNQEIRLDWTTDQFVCGHCSTRQDIPKPVDIQTLTEEFRKFKHEHLKCLKRKNESDG